MRVISFIFVLTFQFTPLKAQNLIPNGSFEIFTACPSNTGQIHLSSPWNSPYSNGPIAEYFNSCAINQGVGIPYNLNIGTTTGYQIANTGNAYAGINVYSSLIFARDFLQAKLIDTLEYNKTYCLEFYVNLLNYCYFGIDGIGAYFSYTGFNCVNSSCFIGLVPQVSNTIGNTITDTLNWVKISGCFTATGNEVYVIIGNFLPDSLVTKEQVNNISPPWSTYYYIDDVSLIEDSTLSITKAKNTNSFSVFPNPANNLLEIVNTESLKPFKFWIEQLSGQSEEEFHLIGNKNSIDVSHLPNGAYIYHCLFDSGKIKSGKLIIAR
jgi:Secretion system C-terminal sorting domain